MSQLVPRVLLVDDDPAMLHLLAAWLEKAGYCVDRATDGREALSAIERQCPDYLITDWEMPYLNGLELCRRVRSLALPHYLYIFFLTAKSESGQLIEGLNVGADDFLCKPVLQSELLARLRAGARVLNLERRLSQLVRTDSLTGLMTRHAFFELLAKEWQRADRTLAPLSCVMLDLDFFKRINDTFGHLAGDAALRTTGETLQANCRVADSACRYGGEEFCVLLPETDARDAAVWAERIRRRLAAAMIAVGGKEIHVTASFGVAQRHGDTAAPEQLVDMADQALLCAKQSGRDCVTCYESLTDAHELELADPRSRESLFRGIVARHVMSPLDAFLKENDSIGRAADLLLRRHTNSMPVLDAAGRLAGVVSEKDLLAAMVSLDCWQQPVSSVMKPNVICYEEDTPILTIYEFLCRVSIRRLVITNGGRPTGTISRGTLIHWFRNFVAGRGRAPVGRGAGAAP